MSKKENEKINPFKRQTINLPFHDFDKIPKIVCMVEDRLKLGEEKSFEVLVVENMETGSKEFVTLSYSINKSVNEAAVTYAEEGGLNNVVFEFYFTGKTEVKGKPFNQFDISICTLEEYKEYTGWKPTN